MKTLRTLVILLAVFPIFSGSLFAHHGRGATYDMNKRVTLKGSVSRVDWRNPHVVIYMDVKGADGKVVTWGFENAGVRTSSSNVMQRLRMVDISWLAPSWPDSARSPAT